MALNPFLEKIKASRAKASKLKLVDSRAATKKLRAYQAEDVEWLRETKRGILAWAPGLGKTLGASEAAELPVIVSVPLALAGQWEEHLKTEYPGDRIVDATRGDFLARAALLKEPFDWLIMNHDMWRTFVPQYENVKTLIVDEFHHFRNRDAKRSKNLALFARLIPRLYGLTATPVYKDVGDLFNQLALIDPTNWTSYTEFVRTYVVTDNTRWGVNVVKTRNERALREMLKQYMREKTYAQAGMYLPERIDKNVILKMDPTYRKSVYDMLRVHYRMQLEDGTLQRYENAGAVLHMLRKVTITPDKLKAVQEIIDDVPDEKPVIVFVWYKEAAAQVAEAFNGIEITGDDSADKRRWIARTGGPEKKRVRVATMASLSEGVDLSEARTVIFVEEDYVPGKNYQAMTRIQRARVEESSLGTEPVLAYWVRYENTVDEIVHRTARSRVTGNALSVLKEALE